MGGVVLGSLMAVSQGIHDNIMIMGIVLLFFSIIILFMYYIESILEHRLLI